eukprot:scaffold1218_cov117-Isochrysis_galbana.AAC.2
MLQTVCSLRRVVILLFNRDRMYGRHQHRPQSGSASGRSASHIRVTRTRHRAVGSGCRTSQQLD